MSLYLSVKGFARPHHGGRQEQKKADVVEGPQAFHHVGLLTNEPPGSAELPFI
jgi:hypothetical protein